MNTMILTALAPPRQLIRRPWFPRRPSSVWMVTWVLEGRGVILGLTHLITTCADSRLHMGWRGSRDDADMRARKRQQTLGLPVMPNMEPQSQADLIS